MLGRGSQNEEVGWLLLGFAGHLLLRHVFSQGGCIDGLGSSAWTQNTNSTAFKHKASGTKPSHVLCNQIALVSATPSTSCAPGDWLLPLSFSFLIRKMGI